MPIARYIVVKGKAGLGNRILSVAGGIMYAELTSRQLVIDWSDPLYSDDRTNVFNRFFAAPPTIDLRNVPPSATVWPPTWRGHLDKTVDQVFLVHEPDDPDADEKPRIAARYTTDFRRIDYPEDVLVRWSYWDETDLLQVHLRNKSGGAPVPGARLLLSDVLRNRLTPSDEIRERVDKFAKENFHGPVIGVHIRHSDNRVSYANYPAAVDQLRAQVPDAPIFLATDNVEVEQSFREKYARVLTMAKWFGKPGEPLHRTHDSPSRFRGGCDALVEMYLLSRCEHLVYSSASSFGLVAALLNSARGRQLNMCKIGLRTHAKRAYRWLRATLTVR